MNRSTPLLLAALCAVAGVAGAQPHTEILDSFPLLELQPVVSGPVDLRFFGTYCQASPKDFCKSVPILPDPCVTLRDMRLHLDHLTSQSGGLLSGTGGFFLDGKRGTLAVAGSVMRRGEARFTAVAPGLGNQTGGAVLSGNGMELTAAVQGRSLTLRKDACGNHPPQVTLTAPFGPSFDFGASVMLASQVTDEDTDFPNERVVFTSNRQGVLGGYRPHSRTLMTTTLVPGNHHVTVTVTDSGGLSGHASLDLTVVNHPPSDVRIYLPAPGATLFAQAPVLLQGHAYDDGGFLAGSGLRWSAQTTLNGPFTPLGVGTEVITSFPQAADPVVLRLTAVDPVGESVSVEETVRVVPSTGNAPPVVAIRQPDRLQSIGPLAGGAGSGIPFQLLATVADVEDAPSDLQLEWTFVALDGPGGNPDPSPAVPNPAPITGTLAPEVTFSVVGTVYYRITFTATDTGGQSASDSVEILATSIVIL
ncbi:MAG: hypothetical protein R2991_09100 [Thermoanaerobaculia bacterium]